MSGRHVDIEAGCPSQVGTQVPRLDVVGPNVPSENESRTPQVPVDDGGLFFGLIACKDVAQTLDRQEHSLTIRK